MNHPIYPCLWFDGQAEEAAKFYCTVFPDSKIISSTHTVVLFELRGKKFMGLNGGPHFTFNEAISFVVDCDTQAEIDHLWQQLTADGGTEGQCGWLKDKYGVSWQIVPSILPSLLSHESKSLGVMTALRQMKKLDIEALQEAYDS